VERRLRTDVETGVGCDGVIDVQHQHIVHSIRAESRQIVLLGAVAGTAVSLARAGVHLADDGRDGEVDVPVVAVSHPVVVRHALHVELSASFHHRVVRGDRAQRRYAEATCPHRPVRIRTPETLNHHPHAPGCIAIFELVRPFDHRMMV